MKISLCINWTNDPTVESSTEYELKSYWGGETEIRLLNEKAFDHDDIDYILDKGYILIQMNDFLSVKAMTNAFSQIQIDLVWNYAQMFRMGIRENDVWNMIEKDHMKAVYKWLEEQI